MNLATARPCGTYYRAVCPTTREEYLSAGIQRMMMRSRPVVWLVCACCDQERRTGDECDPLSPQTHLYFDGDAR